MNYMKHRSGLRLCKQESCYPSRSRSLAGGLFLALSLSLIPISSHAGSFGLADRVVEQKLANGLTVLMVERHQTPVVSLNMTFGVGGVNEQVGQTGLAHLYEQIGRASCRERV